MKHYNLGPHTTVTPQPHARHDAWHKNFSAKERRHLIQEDYKARMAFLGIMVGVVLVGLTMLVFTLFAGR